MWELRKLVKIAAAGGLITGGTGYFFRWLVRQDIRKSEYYQGALESVRNHPESVKILGEPIEEKSIIIDGDGFGCDLDVRWYTVLIQGSKTSARLRYWIEAELESKKFHLFKVELKFENIPGKNFVLKDESYY